MTVTPMRILQLARFEAADRARQYLHRAGMGFLSQRVETRDAFVRALREFAPEVLVADISVTQPGVLEALRIARERSPWLPVIVTGVEPRDAARFATAGAMACVGRERMPRLGATVEAALSPVRQGFDAKYQGFPTVAQLAWA